MNKSGTEPAPSSQWTLVRGARQLLTLRGPGGPRRGTAMADLSMIADGAVLIRDGVIEEVGPTRRIENLVPARKAREIDVAGRVVMPSFADPDAPLVAPDSRETEIRRISRRRLDARASAMAADLVRYGVLTVGAHTLFAPDLQNAVKALRVQHALQSKPLRIRSVYSPPYSPDDDPLQLQRLCQMWMPAIAQKKLTSLIEIPISAETVAYSRALATAAAKTGYNIRVRAAGQPTAEVLELACSAGAVALLGPIPDIGPPSRALADAGCVTVALASRILAGHYTSKREAIDDGTPFALGSGYGTEGFATINPQFLLYIACRFLDITVEEAIVATTYNAVCSLRLSHVTGSLEPGKSADLCVLDVGDYRELARRAGHHDLSLVMRAGRLVYRRPGPMLE